MTIKPCLFCEYPLESGEHFCPDCNRCVICHEAQADDCSCFELHNCNECGRELDSLREDPENNTMCQVCDPPARKKRDSSPKRGARKQPKRQVKKPKTRQPRKSMSKKASLFGAVPPNLQRLGGVLTWVK